MSNEFPPFDLIEFLNRDRSQPLEEVINYPLDYQAIAERCKLWLQEKSQRGKPEVQRNRIEEFDGGFRILCDYDEGFVETLKAMIPYRERSWENSTKSWIVSNPEYLDQVKIVFDMFYEWTYDELEVCE